MLTAIAVLLVAGIWYALYVESQFTYTFEGAHLHIRRRLFGGVPLGSRRIPYSRIAEARPFSRRLEMTGVGEFWGNLLARRGFVLILSPTFFRRGFLRKLWVTPSDFTTFARDLARHGVAVTHVA